VAGKTFRPLAYTVALAMGGSLIYALWQAPVFSDLLMRGPKSKQTHRPRLWLRTLNFIPGIHGRNPHQTSSSGESPTGGHNEPWILRTLLVPYRPLVRFFVRHRWAAVALAVSLLSIGGAIFPLLGSEFTPRLNEGELIVNMTMAPSIALSETKRVTWLAEKRMLEVPEVAAVFRRVGRGDVGTHADPINTIHSLVVLKPESQWRSAIETQEEIEAGLRGKLADMPGVLVNLTQPIQLTVDELVGDVKAELAIKLFGDGLNVLKAKADQIAALVQEIRGAADVQTEQVGGAP
jgi:heavy metal efflux system protein